ncbi:hypothetical protein LOTGIDRAFT_232855 [Lottia gigantea]|uniref:DUF218 domain-containing protein n=1 Tax=Lottia gigantea TaxID=225164 RepID=V4A8Q4_LOTGI|nr:hypothetical protein LOTGIDRAFT_232855 [Lottia gigantea]ESO93132.1 hypothetical protein LOTGIDRAFT_232855 [Lottia gigantea]
MQMDAAQTIWNYMIMGHELKKSDVILVLGNHDIRTAEYASELYLKGLGDWLMFSGKVGSLTKGKWNKPEAEIFRDVALNQGVPEGKIILESEATNTGENIRFSYNKLLSLGIHAENFILVQTPYMERRSYATFKKQWKGSDLINVYVTSPEIGLRDYPNSDIGTLEDIITVMLGCLQRILTYPQKGYQIYQEVPNEVQNAFQYLVNCKTFNNYLLHNS